MITNNEIKLINSLKRKKNRVLEGLFVVEGEKNVTELLNSTFITKKIYATSDWKENYDFQQISPKELARISTLTTPNKVIALAEIPEQLEIERDITSVIIDNINDPGNLGTIVRTADWFGIKQVICSNNSVDVFNPKTIMASMGAIFRVKIIYTNLKEVIENTNVPVYGALLKGKSIYETRFENPSWLLLGSESHGISDELMPFISHKTTIPGAGKTESLNLGISTALYCSEYFKQNSL